jgi:hypothetical protein
MFFDAKAPRSVAKYTRMAEKKFIEDREQLEKLAPMLKAPIKRQVFVCTGKSCTAVGSAEVKAEVCTYIRRKRACGRERNRRAGNPMGEVVLTRVRIDRILLDRDGGDGLSGRHTIRAGHGSGCAGDHRKAYQERATWFAGWRLWSCLAATKNRHL